MNGRLRHSLGFRTEQITVMNRTVIVTNIESLVTNEYLLFGFEEKKKRLKIDRHKTQKEKRGMKIEIGFSFREYRSR